MVKFTTLAKVMKWIVNKPDVDNPDLEMANKYLESLNKAGGRIVNTQKYDQAKCKEQR